MKGMPCYAVHAVALVHAQTHLHSWTLYQDPSRFPGLWDP